MYIGNEVQNEGNDSGSTARYLQDTKRLPEPLRLRFAVYCTGTQPGASCPVEIALEA